MIQNFSQKNHFLRNIHIAYNQAQTMLVAFMVARNGFLTKFYIEIVIQLFSQLLLFRWKNNSENDFPKFFKIFNKKNSKFSMKSFFFRKFSEKKFFIFKIIFFNEKNKVEKKLDHHFDVEFCQESISGNHKCNGALF